MQNRNKNRKRFHRQMPVGSPAGIVQPLPAARDSRVDIVAYGEHIFQRIEKADMEQIAAIREQVYSVVWVHITGLADADLIRSLGLMFSLHKLALEDAVHVHQQVKVDDYTEQLFVVTRILAEKFESRTHQLSIFIGKNFVVSFEQEPSDLVQIIESRIHHYHSQIKKHGSDFLAYSILDAIIDQYFPLLEKFGEELDDLEDGISDHPPRELMRRIHGIRSEMRNFRRFVWKQREALNSLMRSSNPLIAETTRLFLRDCHDHTIQQVELLELFHETCCDLRDVCLSVTSNRMNEIMMVLTVIATIFIPLSFITGLYGMNFNTRQSPWNMPELNWHFGYPFALALMATIAGGMLLFFYRRGWIGN